MRILPDKYIKTRERPDELCNYCNVCQLNFEVGTPFGC